MNIFSTEILQTGSPKDPDAPVLLAIKNLSAVYHKGSLRYIRSGNAEVLRMIYPALRDRNWRTLQPTIRDEKIDLDKECFRVTCKADYLEGDIHFRADFIITGEGNRLTFNMKGQALSGFLQNRTGLCILHPLSVSGKMCTLRHTDGTSSQKPFPEFISPHQPFLDLAGMEWDYIPGKKALLEFSGDIFETEDQRNWTDASYKTYSTPLSLPFPVRMESGQCMEQSVSLTIEDMHDDIFVYENISEISIPGTTLKNRVLPAIGICASGLYHGFSEDEVSTLNIIHFSHYRLEIRIEEYDWETKFAEQVKEAILLNKPVELILYLQKEDRKQLDKVKDILEKSRCTLYSIACFDPASHVTGSNMPDTVYPLIREILPGVPLGAGSNTNFTELNRNRFNPAKADYITFPVCPQVHACDHLTLIENLEGQKHVVESARTYFPGKPVHVSPVTLKKRFNVVATSYEKPEGDDSFPESADPRQMSLICAGWTLATIKMLAEAGISSITLYETLGIKGIIHGKKNPAYPGIFHATSGMIYPVWYLLTEILSFEGWEVINVPDPDPLSCCILGLGLENRRFLAVANLKQENNQVLLSDLPQQIEIFFLDEITYKDLLAHPVNIKNIYNRRRTMKGVANLKMKPCSLVFIRYSV
ncbi:MAG: hypothetical protein AMS27_14800 [Bacteroides sp. SM23_62_1]|nr:MAG: hypothetical protein AMS27_14800 [Bacteroides sp. SM23_62_1]